MSMDPTLALFLVAALFGAYLGFGIDSYEHRNSIDMDA